MVIIFIIKGGGFFAPLQFCAQCKYLAHLLLAFLDLDSDLCLKQHELSVYKVMQHIGMDIVLELCSPSKHGQIH